MPWSANDAHKHKKGLTPEQAEKWAKIANAIVYEQDGDEAKAIRIANSKVSKALQSDRERYVEVFAKALDEGFTDERAHRIAWTAITKHLPGKHNQKDHGKRKSVKARAKSGAKRAAGPEGRAAVLGAAAKIVGSSIYSSKSFSGMLERVMWSIKLDDMAKKERAKIKKAAGDPAEQLAGFLDEAKVETEEDVRRVLDEHRDLVLQAIAEEEGEGVSKHGTHNQKDHGRKGATSKSRGSSSGGSSSGKSKATAKPGIFGSGKDQGKGLDLSTSEARRKQRSKKAAMETAKTLGRAAIATAVVSSAVAIAGGMAFRGGGVGSNAKALFGKRENGDVATPKMIYKGIQKIAEKRGIPEDEAAKLLIAALKKQAKGAVAKSEEASTYVEFAKVDPDKQQVFGWAIVAKDADGNDVIDLQGDLVEPDEVEKAAYDYVIHSRDGGEMHVRKGVSRMIESMVVSPDKLQAMGVISKGETGIPMGWWVGFEITDEGVWKSVKDGRYTGFSIHGLGKRQAIGKREDFEKDQKLIAKAHEELGLAVMRGDDVAVEAIAKHLIGRHEQKDHDPNKNGHSRSDHKSMKRDKKMERRKQDLKSKGKTLSVDEARSKMGREPSKDEKRALEFGGQPIKTKRGWVVTNQPLERV